MKAKKYKQFRDWCFTFMGEQGNEGYTSDTLVSRYLSFREMNNNSFRGVPQPASASEVLRRDKRFKKGEAMESWRNDMVWVSERVVWFLNPDNE